MTTTCFFELLSASQLTGKTFYHGSSSTCGIKHVLLPPEETEFLQEEGRKKNLNQVFFTEDLGLARIYAGRACNRFGGKPKVYRVIPMGGAHTLSEGKGATVYYSRWAFVEEI